MLAVLKPTLSRWGFSSYETPETIDAEVEALRPWVRVLPHEMNADIVVVNSGQAVNRSLMKFIPDAKLIVTTTSGFDHLDKAALLENGISVCRLPMARRDAVVEAALWMLLDLLRSGDTFRRAAASGDWVRPNLPSISPGLLSGRIVGVVGLGVIGCQMAKVLHSLGAIVVGTDPAFLPPGVVPCSFHEMASRCDAVTLHCGRTPQTEGMVSRQWLKMGSPGKILINTARGALVDWDSALDALDSGNLAGLGLDVFPDEPWTQMNAVVGRPNLILTPHAAGYHQHLPQLICDGLVSVVKAWALEQDLPWQLW